MNSDVHPVVAALVLVMAGVALGLWMWASGMAASLGGPAELRTGPNGHSFIQIQNYLVEHDKEGAFLKTHDLDTLDVEFFLGSFAFFSNGDTLLRRGPDPRSFLDNLRAYGRETNRNSIVPEDPGSGLFRCSLKTSACERFGEEGIDFKAAYGVFIDGQTDEVYFSDTTRHLLRKYSSTGVELAPAAGGFEFPNQLMLVDGQLLVADTNHHVVRSLKADSSTFGELIDSKDVVPKEATSAQQTWPSHFARVGEEWWVNNMQTGMNHGGIYVFDSEWNDMRRVELPADADPISILAVGDTVWVSDWNNDVVRRFSAAGEPLASLASAGLEAVLTSSRQERLQYTLLSYAGVAAVVIMFLGLFVHAFAKSMNKPAAPQSVEPDEVAASTDTSPLHLEPDEKVRKRMRGALVLVGVLTLLLPLPLVFIFNAVEKPEAMVQLIAPIGGLIAIVILIAWTNRANWNTAISLQGNTLTLRDYTGRQSSCSIRQVRYDGTAIATRDAIVILGRPKARIYDEQDVQERLIPHLGEAQKVGAFEMFKIQIQFMHPQGIVTVLAILGLLGFGVMQIAA